MANLIKVKRSSSNNTLGSNSPQLSNGELCWTEAGNVLFIGAFGGTNNFAIAGQRVPGTLTANQAIVVNSASFVDTIKIGTLVSNIVLSSTGITLSNTDGEGNTIILTTPNDTEKAGQYYLKADGSWSTVTAGAAIPAGADLQVQYNDGGSTTAGATGLTYNKTGNLTFVANLLSVGAVLNVATSAHVLNSIAYKFTLGTNSTTVATGGVTIANTTNTVTIIPPSTAAALTANKYFLQGDGAWAQTPGGAPAGSSTYVQYNIDGSSFGANAAFTYTATGNIVSIANSLNVGIVNVGGGPYLNSIAICPAGSNTQLLGNTIGRWVITANSWATQAALANASGIYPVSNAIPFGNSTGLWLVSANTISTQALAANATELNPMSNGMLFGNSLGRWVVTANSVATLGALSNTLGIYPTANTIVLGNTTGYWVVYANSVATLGSLSNTLGIYPTSNTIALGNSTGQFNITANTVSAVNVSTAGSMSNALGIYPTANTIVLGNSTGLWVITANSWATAAALANATGIYPTSNGMFLGNTTGQWVVAANSVTTMGEVSNTLGSYPTSNSIALGNATGRYVITANSVATLGALSNTLGIYPTANTIVLGNTTGLWVISANSWTTASALANASGVYPTSNTIPLGNSTGLWIISANSITMGTTVVNSSAMNIAGTTVTANASTISTQDLNVTGNLVVSGTVTTVDTTNLNVKDPVIFLAANNANQAAFTDAVDIGFVGMYGNNATAIDTRYTGLVRDASSTGKIWKLFDATGNTTAPTTTVDFTNTSFSYGILQSWLKCTGNTVSDGTGLMTVNTAGFQLTANSSWYAQMAANTLSLSTALPITSGGLGASLTIATGDLIYGSGTTTIGNLARGADGKILTSSSTTIVWSDLDGGSFA